jgi:hypothetical protein
MLSITFMYVSDEAIPGNLVDGEIEPKAAEAVNA